MTNTVVVRCYGAACVAVLVTATFLMPAKHIASATPDEQQTLYSHVPRALDPDAPPPVASPAQGEGEPLAYLEVPRFGEDWLWTVVEGVTLDDLALGPGHYPGSALPGALGNFAVAGHRAGHGDPFIDFDLLRLGDEITVRQADAWWTYEIINGPHIIEPTTMWMLRQPHGVRKLTLTTCWPKYGSAKRMFIRALLVDWSGRE